MQKANFWGLKVTQQSWPLLFAVSPPLFFLLFLPHFFFSLAGHLVGFILVGKVFRKAFRILGLDERKGRWVVEQDFRGHFQVNVTTVDGFLPFSLVSSTELCSCWYGHQTYTSTLTVNIVQCTGNISSCKVQAGGHCHIQLLSPLFFLTINSSSTPTVS